MACSRSRVRKAENTRSAEAGSRRGAGAGPGGGPRGGGARGCAWRGAGGARGVLSRRAGNQTLAASGAAGLVAVHEPLLDLEPASAERGFSALRNLLRERTTVLLHRDTIDEAVCGILAGYLVYAGLVSEPIVATDTIQRILHRPLGPEARGVIPQAAGA